MHGTPRWVILVAVWAGALIGVVLSVAWITAPRVLSAACYLALGWAPSSRLPQMVDAPRRRAAGALRRRRCPLHASAPSSTRPGARTRGRSTFGFHEVFHALVILAAAVQFIALAGWVFPGG